VLMRESDPSRVITGLFALFAEPSAELAA